MNVRYTTEMMEVDEDWEEGRTWKRGELEKGRSTYGVEISHCALFLSHYPLIYGVLVRSRMASVITEE